MNTTEESLRSIAKVAGIIFIGVFISKILAYLYRIVVARLGAEQYGFISIGIAILGVFVTISLLGMNEGVIRYVSYFKGKDERAKIKGVLSTALKLTTILGIVLSILLFIFSDLVAVRIFHNHQLSSIIKIFAIIIPINVFREILLSTIKAYRKVEYEVFSRNIVENSFKLLLTLLFIYIGFNVLGAALAYLFATIASTIIALYFFRKVYLNFKINKPAEYSNKELLSYCWPLIFNTFIFQVILWTDTFMLGFFKTPSDVGIYNAALPTGQLMYIFPYALMTLFFPVLSELHARGSRQAFESIYKTTTRWIFMINLALLSVFIIFSKQVISVLFGREYLSGSMALVILSTGYFFYYLTSNSNYILMILKKTKLIFMNTIAAALINILLNFILIPKFGIVGAAIATVLSLMIIAILRFIESWTITRINPFKTDYIKILISILIATSSTIYIIRMLNIQRDIYILIFGAILIGLIYILLLAITRSFKENDLIILRAINQKIRGYLKIWV